MDFATLAGLTLGCLIVVVSLFLGGVPFHTILQPEAILIVFGGTLTALLINFSFEDIKEALGSTRRVFHDEELSTEDVVEYLTDASVYARTRGILALQPLLHQVDVPFLQKGLQMVVDNTPTQQIESQLSTEMEVSYLRDTQRSKVFEVAGGVAPTMGIIGAIVGLIQVASMFQSPEQIGSSVAGAFMATLYGVGLSNLVLLPISGKLKHRAKSDWFLKSMMLQGILSISQREHPSILQEKLEAYIEPSQTLDHQLGYNLPTHQQAPVGVEV